MKAINLLYEYKFGGGEKVAESYSKILNRLNCDSITLGIKSNRKNEKDDVILAENKMDYIFFLYKNYSKYNLFFCHCNYSFFVMIIIALFRGRNDKKFFYIQHLEYTPLKRKVIYYLINCFFDYYVEIKSVSYKEVSIINDQKKIDIHNFSIKEHIDFENETIGLIKKYKTKKFKIFLFVGAVKKGKGVDHLIGIATELNKSNCKYKIVFVGDGPLLNEFKSKVKINGLSDYFIFCGFCEQPQKYMRLSDVLLFTSDVSEVTPMVVIESLDNELPVLAFNLEFNTRYLSPNCLFELSNYKDIAEYLYHGDYILDKCSYNTDYAINIFKRIM